MKQRETVIYGGAFNPPTRAHNAILQSCVDYASDRDADVWVMPSGDRIDKAIRSTRETRLALVEAMCADIALRGVSLDINTYELDLDRNTETYETVELLNQQHRNRTFTWVFGSDSLLTMDTWQKGEWLKDNVDMLIVERPGTPSVSLGERATLLSVSTPPISSTELRRQLAEGNDIESLTTQSVARLLHRLSSRLSNNLTNLMDCYF